MTLSVVRSSLVGGFSQRGLCVFVYVEPWVIVLTLWHCDGLLFSLIWDEPFVECIAAFA